MSRIILFLLLAVASFGAAIPSTRLPSAGFTGNVGIPGGIPTGYTQYCNILTGSGITTPSTWVAATSYKGPTAATVGNYVNYTVTSTWWRCISDVSGVTPPPSDPTHWVSVPKLAVGDNVADDTEVVQYALNSCPNTQYVYAPTGNYKLTAAVQRFGRYDFDNVQRPYNIVLRGAGPSLTKFYSSSTSVIFNLGTSDFGMGAGGGDAANVIVSGNTRGSTSVVLTGTVNPLFTVGYSAVILRDNTASGATHAAVYMTDAASQIVKITNINAGTKTITFTPALNEGYSGDRIGFSVSAPVQCGFEDFYMERVGSVGSHNINIAGGEECWVKNVESNKTQRWHIRMEACSRGEVRNCYVHEGNDGGGDSSYGYGLFKWSSQNLVENNIGWRLRHTMILEYGGQGNVYGYNYSYDPINQNQLSTDYLMGDIITHGEARYNMFEGNVAATIRFDCVLGANQYNVCYRNQIQRVSIPSVYVACFGSDIQQWNYYNTLSGNCYQNPPVVTILRRWGTQEDAHSGVISNATNASPIVITYTAPWPVPTGLPVTIREVLGNTAANVTAAINTFISSTTFSVPVAGNGTYTSGGYLDDPQSEYTTLLDGEYDNVTGVTTWAGVDHSLADSYYLSSQPSWWTGGVWPAIGPDLADKFGENPAYRRVNGGGVTTFSIGMLGKASVIGKATIK